MKRVAIFLALILFIASEPVADSTIHTEEQCLSSAIYFEARGENSSGQRAVLDVIYNRMAAYNRSACQVVKMRNQFSWTKHKPIRKYNKEMRMLLAKVLMTDRVLNNEKLYFFSTRVVRPKWAWGMKCRKIGKHYFCEDKGGKNV